MLLLKVGHLDSRKRNSVGFHLNKCTTVLDQLTLNEMPERISERFAAVRRCSERSPNCGEDGRKSDVHGSRDRKACSLIDSDSTFEQRSTGSWTALSLAFMIIGFILEVI